MSQAFIVSVVEPPDYTLDDAALGEAVQHRWPGAVLIELHSDDLRYARRIWRLDSGVLCVLLASQGASISVEPDDAETAIQLALLLIEFLPKDGGVEIFHDIGFPPTYVLHGDTEATVSRRMQISGTQYLRSLDGKPP